MPLSGALFSIHEVIKNSKKLEKSECKKELPIKHAQYQLSNHVSNICWPEYKNLKSRKGIV
jgi:hypothetical protein